MVSTTYEITSQTDGTWLVETRWRDGGDGFPDHATLPFPTLAAALQYTGGCRYDMEGNEVHVLLHGEYIDATGQVTQYYAGDGQPWQWGTDSDD